MSNDQQAFFESPNKTLIFSHQFADKDDVKPYKEELPKDVIHVFTDTENEILENKIEVSFKTSERLRLILVYKVDIPAIKSLCGGFQPVNVMLYTFEWIHKNGSYTIKKSYTTNSSKRRKTIDDLSDKFALGLIGKGYDPLAYQRFRFGRKSPKYSEIEQEKTNDSDKSDS